MAKHYGPIGYAESVEVRPGVWKDQITERMYYMDIVRNSRRLQSSETLNDDINISNKVSIIADPFAEQNFHLMKYVEFMGAKWKITNVEVEHHRLVLSVGGVYNGQ